MSASPSARPAAAGATNSALSSPMSGQKRAKPMANASSTKADTEPNSATIASCGISAWKAPCASEKAVTRLAGSDTIAAKSSMKTKLAAMARLVTRSLRSKARARNPGQAYFL